MEIKIKTIYVPGFDVNITTSTGTQVMEVLVVVVVAGFLLLLHLLHRQEVAVAEDEIISPSQPLYKSRLPTILPWTCSHHLHQSPRTQLIAMMAAGLHLVDPLNHSSNSKSNKSIPIHSLNRLSSNKVIPIHSLNRLSSNKIRILPTLVAGRLSNHLNNNNRHREDLRISINSKLKFLLNNNSNNNL